MDESDAHGQRVLVGIVSWGIGVISQFFNVFHNAMIKKKEQI